MNKNIRKSLIGKWMNPMNFLKIVEKASLSKQDHYTK